MNKEHISHDNPKKLVILIGIPLLLILSLALVFGSTQRKGTPIEQYPVEEDTYNQEEFPQEQYPPEVEQEVVEQYPQEANTIPQSLKQEEYNQIAPTNPNIVRAYADSTKEEELVSGQPYSYPNPYFEWEGAEVKEPGAEIIYYLVSFADMHDPLRPTTEVEGSSFSPQEYGMTLETGNTYTLYVQTVTDGKKAPLGLDIASNTPAIPIFQYIYE